MLCLDTWDTTIIPIPALLHHPPPPKGYIELTNANMLLLQVTHTAIPYATEYHAPRKAHAVLNVSECI